MTRLPLLLAAVVACQAPEDATPPMLVAVRCTPAVLRPWPKTLTLRGLVQAAPDHDARVSAQVAGRLVDVPVREGDAVHRGEVLAEVETETLGASLEQADALIAQWQAARDEAATVVTRTQHLVQVGTAAQQTLDTARTTLAHAAANLDAARAHAANARADVRRAQVRAPFDGVVVHLLHRTGEVVDGTPASPILELADPDALELSASPSASQVVRLHAGQEGAVAFDAWPGRTFHATVRAVSPFVDPVSGIGSVHLALDADGAALPFGLLGTAEVTVGETIDAVVVPRVAVRSRGGADVAVFACRDGQAHSMAVQVGRRDGDEVEILAGLDAGTTVALTEVVGLEDGMPIEVTP